MSGLPGLLARKDGGNLSSDEMKETKSYEGRILVSEFIGLDEALRLHENMN
jgi:hypothetical protein